MSERNHGPQSRPVPRDLPDQQAGHGDDPWDPRRSARDAQADVPETDEAGTGPHGAPGPAGVHPDHPVPEEPSG